MHPLKAYNINAFSEDMYVYYDLFDGIQSPMHTPRVNTNILSQIKQIRASLFKITIKSPNPTPRASYRLYTHTPSAFFPISSAIHPTCISKTCISGTYQRPSRKKKTSKFPPRERSYTAAVYPSLFQFVEPSAERIKAALWAPKVIPRDLTVHLGRKVQGAHHTLFLDSRRRFSAYSDASALV